ncbi:MAG: linear amide C-N hydrolase [Deltaproteobacteria bacterium]|nr:linear amide C-N hydrolase [Deltaproteobacteria bacterium]
MKLPEFSDATMRKIKSVSIFFFFMLCFPVPPALPCTSFHLSMEEGHFVGKNYDWNIGNGLVIVNKRGVHKEAHEFLDTIKGEPARWTSRYGNITFNQYGRELPMGGINEAGLVIEALLLGETRYPDPDARPYVSMLQWIQYQLDVAATTEEVLKGMDKLRIFSDGISPGMHYLICDPTGDCAVVEFIGGMPVKYRGKDLKVHALANSTYEDSLGAWRRFVDSKEERSQPDRFTTAGLFVGDQGKNMSKKGLDLSLLILKKVSQGLYTKWNIIYDLKNLVIYFVTPPSHDVRRIRLASFDFSCATPVKILDIQDQFAGEASGRFRDYTRRMNCSMILESFRNTPFLSHMPEEKLNRLAEYPERLLCNEK